MYLSKKWLEDLVELPKKLSPEELGEALTMHTVEIDDIIKEEDKLKDVVVGQILEVRQHPNADRLQLTKVDIGKEKLDIVCGASNIKPGQKVPVALIGAMLPGGVEIKEAEVRGEKSFGMLCAEDEIGLGDDHAGILILNDKTKLGQKFTDYMSMKDVIFEVDNKSITNRPDLWGHLGMAREISAFLNVKLTKEAERLYKLNKDDLKIDEEKINLDIKVEDSELCPRYMAIVVDGIKIVSSPKWMQEKLIAIGVRPINNIVDITNYVMFELGQPMHAFDSDLIDKIIIRKARKGEMLETLDGEERKLDEEMLVIADGKNPIAVAGVMGGGNSEISDSTKSVIFEIANFEHISIRKTSTKLDLRTESSMRYEKSLDPNLCELAMMRSIELVKKLCPKASIVSKVIDQSSFSLNQGPIEVDLSWLNKIIGIDLDEKVVLSILSKLGFSVEVDDSSGKKIFKIIIPTWRATKDISIKEDILEEVARIYGYERVEEKMPEVQMKRPIVNKERKIERKIKEILSKGAKMSEVSNYSFVGEEQLKKLGIDYSKHIRLANPISVHHTMLRQNLTPNLIDNIKTNQVKEKEISLFEIGSVYIGSLTGGHIKGDDSKDNLPYQEKRLGIILADSGGDDIFKKAKGSVAYLLSNFYLDVDFCLTEFDFTWSEKGVLANIKVSDKIIGSVSKLDHNISKKLGIKKEVAVIEVSLKELFNILFQKKEKKYTPSEKFPQLSRDLAFVVNEKVLYNDIRDEILNFNSLIKGTDLFDMYVGDKLGKDKKSLAFHVTYQANRTLTSKEVDSIQDKLIKKLEERFEAQIRDF